MSTGQTGHEPTASGPRLTARSEVRVRLLPTAHWGMTLGADAPHWKLAPETRFVPNGRSEWGSVPHFSCLSSVHVWTNGIDMSFPGGITIPDRPDHGGYMHRTVFAAMLALTASAVA